MMTISSHSDRPELEPQDDNGEASTPEFGLVKLTRKQRRQQREGITSAFISTPAHSPAHISHDVPSTKPLSSTSYLQFSAILEMTSPIRLLVCSIGNPGSYLNTLHSAGHTVLNALAQSLSSSSFQKSRAFGNGLLSIGSEYTLWQSTSLMNVSGTGVTAAWRQFQKEGRGEPLKLVVVHDELELAVGQVKVKLGSASPKGHNGLKSINGLLKGADYTRIGIGIGRPESRDPNVVAGYVLKKMNAQEKAKIEACAAKVEIELRRLSAG